MLQETTVERKAFGLLTKGSWYIKTSRAIWDRVQIIGRERRAIRIFYTLTRRYRKRGKWIIQRKRRIEEIPIHTIQDARRYIG